MNADLRLLRISDTQWVNLDQVIHIRLRGDVIDFHLMSERVDIHTPKEMFSLQSSTRTLESIRNSYRTNPILNTSHEPKSTTVLELKYR